jgi:branched-chain amino acid transport system ATP-binding protein
MDVVRALADRIVVLHNGELVADGEPAEVMSAAHRARDLSRRRRGGGGMSDAILRLDDVHTDIGQYHILHGISLDVPEGGVHVLLGRNGAGKTTTLRTIMGLWRARKGAIVFRHQDITAMHTSSIARLGIAYVPENMGIFGGLTVEENMRLAATGGRFDRQRLERIFEIFPAMKTFWERQAHALSGGQKQMLAISRAIVERRE